MVEARETSGPGNFQAGGSRWEARAERFARLTRGLNASTDPFIQVLKEALRPADAVLDVGAGAGRYSLPIAPSVARLTAVEPSAGMRANLEEEAARRGITNVAVVATSWEDAEVEPHDVAFVANVLYFVKDAMGFVEKCTSTQTARVSSSIALKNELPAFCRCGSRSGATPAHRSRARSISTICCFRWASGPTSGCSLGQPQSSSKLART